MLYTIYANGQKLYDSQIDDLSMALVNPILKLEMGKAGALDFSFYHTHPLYNSLNKLVTEIVVNEDFDEIFRGRVYETSTSMNGERKVTCEGDLAYLVDSQQPPDRKKIEVEETDEYSGEYDGEYDIDHIGTGRTHHGTHSDTDGEYSRDYSTTKEEATYETVREHFGKLIDRHNEQVEAWKRFSVGTIDLAEADETVAFDSSNYRDTLNALEQDIINQFGGYLRTRRVGDTTYIDLIRSYNSTSSQDLTFAQNIIDLSIEQSAKDVFTVFIPIGDDDLTIESVNGGSKELVNAEGVARYGKIYKSETFSGITEASKLLSTAEEYMNRQIKLHPIKISVTALDLNLLNPNMRSIHIGDKVRVNSAPHLLDRTLDCLSIQINFINPDKNTYDIGDPEESFSRKYRKESKSTASTADKASKSGRAGGQATSKLYETIKEHGRDLMIDADRIAINAQKITIHTAEIMEVYGILEVYRLLFNQGSGNYLNVINGLTTKHFDASGAVNLKGFNCIWRTINNLIGGSASLSNLGGAVTIDGVTYDVEVWGDVNIDVGASGIDFPILCGTSGGEG